jgi:hypothetical protein
MRQDSNVAFRPGEKQPRSAIQRWFTGVGLGLMTVWAAAVPSLRAQPVDGPPLPLAEVRAGQTGEVWTVFAGTRPEPFTVEVTGVIRSALGPGKSIILCRMTDPRVQGMGAVAGMSGSPLYIGGRFAGALSYQLQTFETLRYAGFTPQEDMAEAAAGTGSAASAEAAGAAPAAAETSAPAFERGAPGSAPPLAPPNPPVDSALSAAYRPLRPTFSLSGLSPVVAALMAPRFAALGLDFSAVGGSTQGAEETANPGSVSTPTAGGPSPARTLSALHPGDAVAVALATGDITLAGTGTVSRIEGDRVVAFGHPMLGLGEVQLPMCAAEIVTILPSSLESVKIANVGAVIGRIDEDRLSAVSGTLGPGPAMVDVDVTVSRRGAAPRRLRFAVIRQAQLTPVLVATGLSQAILGANDAGLSNGFRLASDVTFSPEQTLATTTVFAGPQGLQQGLNDFLGSLAANLRNPYAPVFPRRIRFQVEPLEENPAVTLDRVQLSRTSVRGGERLAATLAWRDYQGQEHRAEVEIPVAAAWSGRTLEVIAAPGRLLDELTGHPHAIPAAEVRSLDAYLDALRQDRPTDGLDLVVVEKSSLFLDQTTSTPEAPGSIERIAHASDELRFQRRDALLVLWETHLLPGKVATAIARRAFQVVP